MFLKKIANTDKATPYQSPTIITSTLNITPSKLKIQTKKSGFVHLQSSKMKPEKDLKTVSIALPTQDQALTSKTFLRKTKRRRKKARK